MSKYKIDYEKHYKDKYNEEFPIGVYKRSIEYFLDESDSIRHRIGGPAFIHQDELSYWRNGLKHRLNAPAQILSDIALWYEFGSFLKEKYYE